MRYHGEDVAQHTLDHFANAFDQVYINKEWGDGESLSGLGSHIEYANGFLQFLLKFVKESHITSISDLSCGDCNWIKPVFGQVRYYGLDVSKVIIEANKSKYEDKSTSFEHSDILTNLKSERRHELCIIRHTLEHLPTDYVVECLTALRSKSQYAIITSANNHDASVSDLTAGSLSREINLLRSPFVEILGQPLAVFWDSVGDALDRGCWGHLYKFL
jgi:hypothetical protein